MMRRFSLLCILVPIALLAWPGCGEDPVEPDPEENTEYTPSFVMAWSHSEFGSLTDVTCDGAGRVYVYDSDGFWEDAVEKVHCFEGDSTYVRSWGQTGQNYGQGQLWAGGSVQSVGSNILVRQSQGVTLFGGSGGFVAFHGYEEEYGDAWKGLAYATLTKYGNTVHAAIVPSPGSEPDKIQAIWWGDYEGQRYIRKANTGWFGWDTWQALSFSSYSLVGIARGKSIDISGTPTYLVYLLTSDRVHVYALFAVVEDYSFRGIGAYNINDFGGHGVGEGRFDSAAAITCDSDGNVYVLDNGRVQKFTAGGRYLTQWPVENNGQPLINANGIAVDDDGNIYVSCSWPNLILKYH